VTDAGVGGSLHIEAPARVWELSLRKKGSLVCGYLEGGHLARWSADDGKLVSEATYQGPALTAGSVAPDGDRLAIGTAEPAVRVLDAATLSSVAALKAPPSPCVDLAYSADGTLLAGFSGHRVLELRIWSIASGAPIASYADPSQEPAAIAFHPGGRLAAVSLLTGDVVILDLGKARPVRTLSDARMASAALAFSPDGSSLIAAPYDGTLLVWDTRDWRVRQLEGIPGAMGLAISADGALAAVARSSFNPPEAPAEVRWVDLRSGKTQAKRVLGIASPVSVAFPQPSRLRIASSRATSIEVQTLG
jgi:WD40 repeat protein